MNGQNEDEAKTAVRRDRFSGGPAREFLSSLAGDERIFEADLAVDRAHVIMLAEQGIIDADTAGSILTALRDIEASGHDTLPDGEDVHEAIETAVIDRIGAEGGKMHTARSRNDEVATCIRYRLRSDLLDLLDATLGVREILLAVADEHAGTVMPGYTHLQPAQPTTVAHYLLSYESALARDTQRLLGAYDRTNRSPLGGAAFAGTPFDIDRERTADLLGFDGIVRNSMDAASARDFLGEATAALATQAITLSGLAEDLIIFANRGFLELDDDYASTSSIMPQKKNPDTLELVRAVAGDVVGASTSTFTSLKGLPRAYNRDLQRVHPHAFDAIDAVVDATEVAGGAIDTASWNDTELAAAAGAGFSTATGVADVLAMAGIPFRTAHEIVAAAAERYGDDVTAANIDTVAADVMDEPVFSVVDPDAISAALDPAESVASRDSVGGPAKSAVTDAIHESATELEHDETTVTERREAIETTRETLATEVAVYV